jgi:RNA polymerase sigma factor (sigma-70 family)
MLKQTTLGFKTEADFIVAVQAALRKEEFKRTPFDRAVLQAFVDDYNNVIQNIVRQWEFGNKDAREELSQEVWAQVCAHLHEWKFKGYKFTTWLFPVALTAIANWWRGQGIIRLPYLLYRNVKAYTQAQEKLWSQLEREPTDEELAGKLHWDVEQVRKIALIKERIDIMSLDEPIGNDENDEIITTGDLVPTPPALDIEDRLIIEECIEQLGEIYRVAFILYYVEGYTQKEIASMLGVNQDAVNTRISRARNKFKQCLKDKGLISV